MKKRLLCSKQDTNLSLVGERHVQRAAFWSVEVMVRKQH